ncbi:MAG: FtsH protease activity modulator HflK [Gammaproteobacteria bacterium]
MSWHPDQNKDPWGRDKKKPQGPPDLDALLRDFKNKLWKLLGFKSNGVSGAGNNPTTPKSISAWIGVVIIGLIVLWGLSGIYIVSPAERAVVLRFGRYVDTMEPGPHWLPTGIDSKSIVNVQKVSNFTWQSEMLTKDENIVSVAVAVQYRIQYPRDYLFNVADPNASLEQATASALRQVVGHNTLDSLLTTGRAQVRDEVGKQLQRILSNYKAGLLVTDVTLQSIKPPEAVTAAFDDAIKAREDEQAYINKAEAYANQVTAGAQGQAARILQEAEAYQKEVVLQAQANIVGYLALVPEYQNNPKMAQSRLYLNAMETVLKNSSKVFVDQTDGHSMFYLPLDKLTSLPSTSTETSATTAPASTTATPTADAISASVNDLIGRSSYPTRGGNS